MTPRNWLPRLYQRFRSFWDRAVPAAGLALLLWAVAEATGTFPSEWRLFFAGALFLIGVGWPAVAYVTFTFLVAVPLYRISIYMAAIVLAVLILSSHWAMRHLGATVLTLAAPAFLPWHLEASLPFLAGLWWGEVGGALVGGLAAVWLKLLAGMAHQPLDLVRLSGWTPTGEPIVSRFSAYNSLQTLVELFGPFAHTSRLLLFHVLQVLLWAAVGYGVGWLARRTWSDRWRGWSPVLSVAPSAAALGLGYIILPRLLNLSEKVIIFLPRTLVAGLSASWLVAAMAREFYLYLRRPLRRPPPRRAPAPARPTGPPAVEWEPTRRPRPASDTDEDVIMLEID